MLFLFLRSLLSLVCFCSSVFLCSCLFFRPTLLVCRWLFFLLFVVLFLLVLCLLLFLRVVVG